jgi:chorismate synthase
MLRFLTAGESHGPQLTVIIEGLPAGIPIDSGKIQAEMQKRKIGSGSGGRQQMEQDNAEIVSGVRHGKSLGSPITLVIRNKDFQNWEDQMNPEPRAVTVDKVTEPRPGHADLAGVMKYGFDDVRNVLERASARETTARVAAGAIFKQFLAAFGIELASHTLQIGKHRVVNDYDFTDVKMASEVSPLTRCVDKDLAEKMEAQILEARQKRDTLGGIVEVWAMNVPVGLGSHVHWDRKMDGQIAQALMSIQSVKAVEIGEGVTAAESFGSEVHDSIEHDGQDFQRSSNRAGGLEGGITNGQPLVVRVYHKPIATLYNPLPSVDIATKEPVLATIERSDICVIPRAGVIAESMLAYVLAKNLLEKFGGDCLSDIQNNVAAYKARLQ